MNESHKHKRTLMHALCHKEGSPADIKNLLSLRFLSGWLDSLMKDDEGSCTIKTYLGSVKHYLDY